MTGWTEEGLIRSWRALAKQDGDEKARYVHLTKIGDISVEAGCHFPLGQEGLVFCFPRAQSIDTARLPEGKGFDVSIADQDGSHFGATSIALIRKSEGSPDIFALLAVDILRTLEIAFDDGTQDVLEAFFERLKEWQGFMSRTQRPLSPDAQLGLLGELWFLNALAQTSLENRALDCWQGPLRAAQDFRINGGAAEIKSTLKTGSFVARINSIEQLDGAASPLYLCGLRFEEKSDGVSLVSLVAELRSKFQSAGAQRGFNALLMVAGYLDEHHHLYDRAVSLKETKIFRVEGDVPRLIRTQLPSAIRSARYDLDLDAIESPSCELEDVFTAFGLD